MGSRDRDREKERERERRRERKKREKEEREREGGRAAQPTRNVRQAAMIMTNQTMTHKTIVLENCRGEEKERSEADDWPFGWNGWTT